MSMVSHEEQNVETNVETVEDIALFEAIKEGMATPDVSRGEIFGSLALDE